jgi:hypothetical protein
LVGGGVGGGAVAGAAGATVAGSGAALVGAGSLIDVAAPVVGAVVIAGAAMVVGSATATAVEVGRGAATEVRVESESESEQPAIASAQTMEAIVVIDLTPEMFDRLGQRASDGSPSAWRAARGAESGAVTPSGLGSPGSAGTGGFSSRRCSSWFMTPPANREVCPLGAAAPGK